MGQKETVNSSKFFWDLLSDFLNHTNRENILREIEREQTLIRTKEFNNSYRVYGCGTEESVIKVMESGKIKPDTDTYDTALIKCHKSAALYMIEKGLLDDYSMKMLLSHTLRRKAKQGNFSEVVLCILEKIKESKETVNLTPHELFLAIEHPSEAVAHRILDEGVIPK